MNTAVWMAQRLGKQIVIQAPKYGAKLILGVPVEVGIYYGSKAIIKKIEEEKTKDNKKQNKKVPARA